MTKLVRFLNMLTIQGCMIAFCAVGAGASSLLHASPLPLPDSTDLLADPPEEDEYSPKRKANGEFIIGWMTANAIYEQNGRDPLVVPRSFLQFGWGGAIPLTELGSISTLWLKASGLIGLSFSDPNSNGGDPDLQADVSIPIHAVFSYGALRRKSVAWGGSAGLGINVARRFQFDEFTVAPSAVFELLYAPRAVYGVRAMVDLLPATLEEGVCYHTWSIQFFIGV